MSWSTEQVDMNRHSLPAILALLSVAAFLASPPAVAQSLQRAALDENGVYHMPEFAVPPSELTSPEYRRSLVERGRQASAPLDFSSPEGMRKTRAALEQTRKKLAEEMQQVFPVLIESTVLGGTPVSVITPKSGIAAKNRNRVLVNLHGGGMFALGGRYEGHVASIPIASLGRIKVIAVEYRMWPEHRFPAASEDVANVYAELLKTYKHWNIGIYGYSSGAALAAQSTAWFQTHGLPVPGAISLHGGGAVWGMGDSAYLAGGFLFGIPPYPAAGANKPGGYFEGADISSAAVSPGSHPEVLSKFPPTLITNSTRDPTLSFAAYTHSALVSAGREADLHVAEGMPHVFEYDYSLPEARRAYDVLIRFYDKHLGHE